MHVICVSFASVALRLARTWSPFLHKRHDGTPAIILVGLETTLESTGESAIGQAKSEPLSAGDPWTAVRYHQNTRTFAVRYYILAANRRKRVARAVANILNSGLGQLEKQMFDYVRIKVSKRPLSVTDNMPYTPECRPRYIE